MPANRREIRRMREGGGCEESRDIQEFIDWGCLENGNLYLGKFELGTVYMLLALAVVLLVSPAIYWYRWRRLALEGTSEVSITDLLGEFRTPDDADELWSKCLVVERGDKERAKYAYVEAVAEQSDRQRSIPAVKRAGFIVLQLVLTAISFGIFRDLVGSGQYFISGFGGLAILYFATSN